MAEETLGARTIPEGGSAVSDTARRPGWRVSRRMAAAHSIDDLRRMARRRVARIAFDYFDGGVESEKGMARNRSAFDDVTLFPRYMVDVSVRDSSVELFGKRYAAPYGISPTGLGNLAWPGTDLAIARTARARNLPFVLSTPASTDIETVAAAAPGQVWFQLYVPRERRVREDLLRRADAAGIRVLVVTVDVPIPAKRERDLRNGFVLPLRLNARNLLDLATHPEWSLATLRAGAPRLRNLLPYVPQRSGAQTLAAFMAEQIAPSNDWSLLDDLRRLWPHTLVVKGLLTAADARIAVERGADGVAVSNHGGRQLDAGPAPLHALPAVVEAVAGKVPVLFDSGVRRGGDILKALALGASFVFAGRPTLYGAGAGGEAGVDRAVGILLDEFDRALGQLGCPRAAEINRGGVAWSANFPATAGRPTQVG
ncbi:alpha-hydroxy acid oxidase [Roseomonas sp. BN140053]|uniref:alpha-hydroxy acid oxidase n=1 Tax=Roseomonas sp. BN140053 TaxID=3391898 RepID=UPI0039ED0A9D